MNPPNASAVVFAANHQWLAAGRYRVDASTILSKVGATRMDKSDPENSAFVKNSVLYKEFLAEREEILRHKWIESEKAGHDIGFEKALLDWIVKHRSAWRERRQKQVTPD
jgi:hypothetical protein